MCLKFRWEYRHNQHHFHFQNPFNTTLFNIKLSCFYYYLYLCSLPKCCLASVPSEVHGMERMNLPKSDSSPPSWAFPNCGLQLLLLSSLFLFFSTSILFQFGSRVLIYVRPSMLICLSLLLVRYCYTRILLRVETEWLLNQQSYSSPYPSVFSFSLLSCMASCSVCLWSGSCSFTALGLFSKQGC